MEKTTYRVASFVLVTKYYLGDQIENNETDGKYGPYERQTEGVYIRI